MPIRFSQPGFGLALIVTVGLLFFAFGAFQVVAQNYLEPTGQAPESNVIDFINEKSPAQARYGKIIINAANTTDNPDTQNPAVPFLRVKGNALFLGTVSFDALASTKVTWHVNPQTPSFVASGTYTPLGKLTVASTTGAGVYAGSGSGDAVSAGTTVENASSVYGEALPPPGVSEISAGVQATATAANGIGLNAIQSLCDGTNQSSCGVAGKFEGNFVVSNGKLYGDGRNIYKAFSVLDQGNINGDGIGIKTFEISSSGTTPNIISPNETFLSMSAYVGSAPYNPNDANTHITYSQNTQSLAVTVPIGTSVTVQIYYYKKFGAAIVDAPQGGNIITAKNFQVGISPAMQYQFYARLSNGSSSTDQFSWSLYKNNSDFSNSSNACSTNVSDPDHCGSIIASGTSAGSYTAPSTAPAVNRVWVVARWNTSPTTVYAFAELDMYTITIVPPSPATFFIGGSSKTFTANVVGPTGIPAPSVSWSIVQPVPASIGTIVSISDTEGSYMPAASIANGTWPWTGKIKASLLSIPDFFTTYDVTPIPNPNDITFEETFSDGAQAGQPANQQVGTGSTLTLKATAATVPTQYQHTFSWGLIPLNDSLAPVQTDDTTRTVTYTAAGTLDMAVAGQRARTVSVSWNGQAASAKTVMLYPGEASPQSLAYSLAANLNSSNTLTVQNFNTASTNRAIYSINGIAVTGTLPQAISTTCGTLTITAVNDLVNGASGTCTDPALQQCTRAYTIQYNAAASICLASVPVVMSADRRETSTISVRTTSTPTCRCSGCSLGVPCGATQKIGGIFQSCDTCCMQCQAGTIIIGPGGGGAN